MKMHDATNLHFDLRLEWNGALLSWALPIELGCLSKSGDAVEMDDHRVENWKFEGVHWTGPMIVWDCGTWEPHPDFEDVGSSLEKGLLRFRLRGERLQCDCTLTLIDSSKIRPRWSLAIQTETETHENLIQVQPISILSGKTMDEVVWEWNHPEDRHPGQGNLFGSAGADEALQLS
ncbi:MAG TPA: DNA polymerase ligase N-terminal domain-containing protein [Acidobacteriaceae bacterium]|jgi:bifunctional non-homologous end joining protein LigD